MILESGMVLESKHHYPGYPNITFALSAGAVKYTNILCGGVSNSPPNEFPGYDTKQSDGEVTVMLELWVMRSTPLLPLLPGPLWPGVVIPDKGAIYGLDRTQVWFLEFTAYLW